MIKEYKVYYRCPKTRSWKNIDGRYYTIRLILKNGEPFQLTLDGWEKDLVYL